MVKNDNSNNKKIKTSHIPKLHMTSNHVYSRTDGRKYASVTTMLRVTKPKEDRDNLAAWRASMTPKVADYIVREASAIGTLTHLLCEQYLDDFKSPILNGPLKHMLIASAHFRALRKYLDRISAVQGTEIRLCSDAMELAGTADCVALFDGIPSIVDFKTKRSPQMIEWMEDYCVQCTAYAAMWEELTGQHIQQVVILVSVENGTTEIYKARTEDYTQMLAERLKDYRGMVDDAPDVLTPAKPETAEKEDSHATRHHPHLAHSKLKLGRS